MTIKSLNISFFYQIGVFGTVEFDDLSVEPIRVVAEQVGGQIGELFSFAHTTGWDA